MLCPEINIALAGILGHTSKAHFIGPLCLSDMVATGQDLIVVLERINLLPVR